MALAAIWLAVMVGGADWSRILRSGYGSLIQAGGHNASEAADIAARATTLALEAGTPPPRSALEYWNAATGHLDSFYSSRQAQNNLLSWDNVGTLAGALAARVALASEVADLRKSARANFTSKADMVDHFTTVRMECVCVCVCAFGVACGCVWTVPLALLISPLFFYSHSLYSQPAQLAVLSWMATPKYVPADVIGPLPGFGTGVKYIGAGNLAIAYENAWGSTRLTAAATALALELADLAAAMDKYSRRTAWRCWARSQARAIVGRVPGFTQPFTEVVSTEESANLKATAMAPLVDSPAPTAAWRSFVAGVGPSPPRFVSHRGASCPTNRSLPCDCSAYVSPSPNPTTMFGALVGGPNSAKPTAKGFHGHLDDRTSYETNEPALDYNAGWLITTMALAGSQIDQSALSPDTLSTHTREFPVSHASAAADADVWDACIGSGVGWFPVLPSAFVADVRNASERSIARYRFHPAGTGRLRTAGWQPAGLLMALTTAGVAAAYFLANSVAAARGRGQYQLWYEGAVRVAAARDDARMLAALRCLAEKTGGRGGATPRHTRSLRFSPECTVPDGSGFTALLAGAAGATRDGGGSVEWLLAAGADPRAVKKDGWNDTALHYAAATGSARAACALVAAAPGLATATNFAGCTPADVARDCGHAVLADWLNAAAAATTDADAQMPPPPSVVALLTAATAAAAAMPLTEAELADAAAFAHRGYDGWGSHGVTPARGVTRFRVAAVAASAAWLGYLLWRALRTLEESSSAKFVYSVVFWLTEGGVLVCGVGGCGLEAVSLVVLPTHPPHLLPSHSLWLHHVVPPGHSPLASSRAQAAQPAQNAAGAVRRGRREHRRHRTGPGD